MKGEKLNEYLEMVSLCEGFCVRNIGDADAIRLYGELISLSRKQGNGDLGFKYDSMAECMTLYKKTIGRAA